MKIYVLTAIAASVLPFMALAQTTDEQQTTTQGKTKETQTTAPATGKNMRSTHNPSSPQTKPEAGTSVRGQTNVKNRTHVNGTQSDVRSGTSQTTTVNKDEFRMRHNEMFSLGRDRKSVV